MSDEQVRFFYIFTGRVQGVGFRYKAKYLAAALHLTGWVKNGSDGEVMMEAQGRRTDLEKLLAALQQDRYIEIENIDARLIPLQDDERYFRITDW